MAKADTNIQQTTPNAEAQTEAKAEAPKVRHPEITVDLVGRPGTEFKVVLKVAQTLRKAKVPADQINAFMSEATTAGHTNLLATVMKWVTVR